MIRFLHSLWIALLATCLLVPVGYGQDRGRLAGTIRANDTQGPLPGANVAVVGTDYGTSTSADGTFRISGLETGQYDVRVSFVGYQSQTRSVTIRSGETTTLQVTLRASQLVAEEVVVTGSRRQEKVLEAPVQVEALSANDIETSAGGTFLSAMSTLKGVDFARVGINGQSVSMRGFNNNFNTRLLQMKDGRVAQLPGTGLPQGNFLPTSELDVEQVEVVVGPASALYGPNAHTGVVNVITKTPWDESGAALDVRGGQQDMLDVNGRVAGTINDNVGWKVTGQYMTATDYKPPTGGPNAEPADSTHFFGEDNVFNEPALVEDYDISSVRTEGSLYYRFGDGWQAEATYGFSENDNFGVTNNGRNRILGWQVQYQSLRVTGDHWFAQATHTSNDAGNTYQINGVAGQAEDSIAAGVPRDEVLRQLPSIREDNRFVDKGELWDSEAQYNNSFNVGLGTLDLVTGVQYRRYLPDSEGTFLADAAGQDIDQTEVGGYLQFDYRPTDAIRINAAARVDEHSEYDTQFSPKAAVVYTVAPNHNVRATYNRAFKTPTILNNYLFIGVPPLGRVARGNVGGYTIRDGPTTSANVVRQIDPLQPEEVNTIEIGYKGVFNQRLFVNLVGYNSWYTDFISPLTTVANSIPSPDNPNPTYAFQDGQIIEPNGSLGGLENGFLLTYFNFGSATVRGLDFGLRYAASERLELSGNLSLIELSDFEQGDAAEPLLLNVPTTKVKGSVTVRDVGFDNYFVSASGRWKSAYTFRSGYWDSQTFYSDGEIPSRFTANLTAGYTVPNTGLSVKASVTNLFDTNTPDVLGAPRTGRLVWVSATYKFRGLDF